ncbi:hypothetical protein LCGC14_2750080 [marine sediment metagenome]|uniref:50S ribosomal protein L31 n=1 Tax=marine sediment metagenome TaxID=412755 RepID=A0A0F9BTN2_9ZZZZ
MKAKIHPEYVDAVFTCACGNSWQTRATRPQVRLDVCSKCHPFFTGEQRIVDTKNLGATVSFEPYHSHLYVNIVLNSPQPTSLMCRANE